MPRTSKQPTYFKRPLMTPVRSIVTTLIILGLILLGLELTNTTHILHNPPQTKYIVTAGTPVAAPKQKTGTTTRTADKTPVTNSSGGGNGVVDTQGSKHPDTDSSQWIVSQSGYITVKSPVANTKLSGGSEIIGSAKVAQVNYRLIDNNVGVLTQGTLSVLNGNFSGTLHFQPKGTGGRLDIFSTDAQGVEYNEVQINVAFQ